MALALLSPQGRAQGVSLPCHASSASLPCTAEAEAEAL